MAESLAKLAAGVGSLLFRQLQDADTGTFTYLLADPATAEAVLIDPVFERQHRDLALIRELGLQLVASLDTHVHADHVTASWCLHAASGCAIGLSAIAGADFVTRPLAHGDRKTDRQTGRQACKQAGRQAGGQGSRQAGRQADRKTGRQTANRTTERKKERTSK